MNYKLYLDCKKAYENNQNIMDLVKKKNPDNRSLAIEIAYDLQAGSYIKDFYQNQDIKRFYTNEVGSLLERYINKDSIILNVGAGELWTISLMLEKSAVKPKKLYNLEISWSRLHKGSKFWNSIHGNTITMKPFVADMLAIPLLSKSVDIVTSSHGLEPNGSQLEKVLAELFRVGRDKCVLFEPCYELCSKEGQQRMDRLGYIKDIASVVDKLGGKVEEVIQITNSINKLNPTACFVIKPPSGAISSDEYDSFTVPGTDYSLELKEDCYYSKDTGLAFPILGTIPILKNEKGILASKY